MALARTCANKGFNVMWMQLISNFRLPSNLDCNNKMFPCRWDQTELPRSECGSSPHSSCYQYGNRVALSPPCERRGYRVHWHACHLPWIPAMVRKKTAVKTLVLRNVWHLKPQICWSPKARVVVIHVICRSEHLMQRHIQIADFWVLKGLCCSSLQKKPTYWPAGTSRYFHHPRSPCRRQTRRLRKRTLCWSPKWFPPNRDFCKKSF